MERLVESTVQVPPKTGVAGFLRTIETLLRLPRLQKVTIDARGAVQYTRLVLEGAEEPEDVVVNFQGLAPYDLIRNSPITEVRDVESLSPAELLLWLLGEVTREGSHPAVWVLHDLKELETWLNLPWFTERTSATSLLGYPLLFDADISPGMLLLGTAPKRGGELVECTQFFKISTEACLPKFRQTQGGV